jgi:hypothetical protein
MTAKEVLDELKTPGLKLVRLPHRGHIFRKVVLDKEFVSREA